MSYPRAKITNMPQNEEIEKHDYRDQGSVGGARSRSVAAGTGYRAVLRLNATEDAIRVAEQQVRSWLVSKLKSSRKVDAWDGSGSFQLTPQLSIGEVRNDDERSGVRSRLYRVLDSNPGGDFEIRVIALSSPNAPLGLRQTVIVEGAKIGESTEQAIDSVATPNLVRDLLEQFEIHDGGTRLSGTPHFVRQGDVHDVVRSILDPLRVGTVIVASSVDRETDARWHGIIDSLTVNSVGVAAVFVVCADAQGELETALPDSHAVPRGRVRTFIAKVDFSDQTDGRRHQFLGPETLARSISGSKVRGHLPRVHARGPRRQLLELSLPSDVRRAMALIRRAETGARREAEVRRRIDSEPRTPSTPTGVGNEILALVGRIVRKWLKRDQVGADDLNDLDALITTKDTEVQVALEQIDEVAAQLDDLSTAVSTALSEVEEKDLELAIEAERTRGLERENQYLRQGLKKVRRFDLLDVPSEARWDSPETVGELVLRVSSDGGEDWAWLRSRVLFTGDSSIAAEVEKRDPHGRYAHDLWDYVRILFEYAEAKTTSDFRGNVHMYLSDESEWFKCSPSRHGGGESDTVANNSNWRAERVFSVPATVDADEKIYMGAHFKPTHRDTFAPRMHYLDDVAGSGRSYIGYVGPHLTNTKS
jgi:hypothetical protein